MRNILLLLFAFKYVFADKEQEELNEWIKTLSDESLNYYKTYNPERLRTTSENMEITSKILAKERADIYGVEFSGPFTNNTVLQREPLHAAFYGLSTKPHVQITLTFTDENTGKSSNYTTESMSNGDWKILLPDTYENGGKYTATVSCEACTNKTVPNASQTIYNVTFGDVYYCSGQSNMWLPMVHTFSRNYTYDNITKLGKYKNIRFFVSPFYCTPDEDTTYVTKQSTKAANQWQQSYQINLLNNFASPCWYFAQVLSDKYSLSNVTFGLISTAVGGSIIESWVKNFTIQPNCNNCTFPITNGFGCLYNGLVLPFINYTIKAALWYQGENDVGRYPYGNVINNTGYACLEKLMIQQWRSNWSVVTDTTDSQFHFGLVTLASGTSEGNAASMGGFRWAQSLNYDVLPNPAGVNTFIAQGYDIGEPWGKPCSGYCNLTDAPYSLLYTQWYDGPIHPRPKIYVGQRLARGANKFIYGNDEIWTGPLISGCTFDGKKIVINFNKTLLYNEKVIVQGWAPWYNISIPPPLHWTAFEVLVNKKQWVYTNDDGLSGGSDGLSVVLDVSNINGTVDGLRYAWNDYPCCGELNREQQPCPMSSCPVVTSDTLLPAPPIWAMIENGKCVCYSPQQC